MTRVLQVVLAVLTGILLGLLYTDRSVGRDNGSTVVGDWHTLPGSGVNDLDPYTLATIARAGILPLGTAEGLSFVAATDGKGAALSSRCDYRVKGPMPTARYWTLSVLNDSGFPVANESSRYGFTSAEVLRFADEPLVITISSEARSGNWLPMGGVTAPLLMLRLYDTGLSTVGVAAGAAAMPSIERLVCR